MNAAALLALQQLDSALDHVEHRRQRLAERNALVDAQAELKAQRRQLESVAEQIRQAQAVIDEAEREGDVLAAKRASLEAKLKTVIAPRQAEALMSEIAAVNARHDELDDTGLAALEQQADADEARAGLEAGLPALERSAVEAQSALDRAEAGLDEERDGLLAQRSVAGDALTSAEIELYEAKRARHHGVGVAKLEGRNCSGCHLDLSPAELDEIRATAQGELAECPQCNRILVG